MNILWIEDQNTAVSNILTKLGYDEEEIITKETKNDLFFAEYIVSFSNKEFKINKPHSY